MLEQKAPASSEKRQRSSPYPRFSLQEVEKFSRVAFDEGSRNCDHDIVAKKAGYSGANNGSFLAMRSAANQFGLILSKGDRISVSEEWIMAFLEDTNDSLGFARQEAVQRPTMYKLLLDTFNNHQLPPPDKLAKTISLDQRYGITKDAAAEAVKIFIESARYANIINDKNFVQILEPKSTIENNEDANKHVESDYTRGNTNFDSTQHIGPPNIQMTPRSPVNVISSNLHGLNVPADMEKQELTFRGGKKAYFIMPVPLPAGEKTRLTKWLDVIKMQIELTLEDVTESEL